MENIYKTYLIVFFGIALAICSYLAGNYLKFDAVHNLLIAILFFLATLIFEMRVQIEKIEITANQARLTQRILETDPRIAELFDCIANQYCISESKKYHPFDKHVEDGIAGAVNAIQSCFSGQIIVEPRGIHTFGIDGMLRTQKTIRAVSAASVDKYWNNDWGRHYLKAQTDILARGVSIQRIFIVSGPDDLAKKSATMKAQKDIGIEVFVLNLQNAKAGKIVPRDFLIQDDIVGVEVKLDSGGIETIETISFNNKSVAELKSTFDLYMKSSSMFE